MFCLLLLLLNISIQIWIERERLKIMRMLIEILQKKENEADDEKLHLR